MCARVCERGRSRRVTSGPNTSEPFYKVNKMETATAYPRLNATSYFQSSNVSPFCRPGPVSPLAFPFHQATLLQTLHRCRYHSLPPSYQAVLPGSSSFRPWTDRREAIPPVKDTRNCCVPSLERGISRTNGLPRPAIRAYLRRNCLIGWEEEGIST